MTPNGILAQFVNQIHVGHALEVLKRIPDGSIHCCLSSPPYWHVRDYQIPPVYWPAVSYSPMPGLPEITIPEQEANLGLEPDIWAFVGHIVAIYREVWRVLRKDGTCWINLGDSYITSPPGNNGKHSSLGDGAYKRRQDRQLGHGEDMGAIYQKPKELKMKDLAGIPWRCAYALQADGWYLRADCPWLKASAMPESVYDRPAKAHEYVFLLSKSNRYYFDMQAVKRPAATGYNGSSFTKGKTAKAREHLSAIGQGERQNQEGEFGRNLRTTDWFYESLSDTIAHLTAIRDSGGLLLSEDEPEAFLVNPKGYPGAHFAVWPEKLVEPMILSSTSQEGACENCGASRVRVVERKTESQEKPQKVTKNGIMLPDGARIRHGLGKSTLSNTDSIEVTTTGWRASCSCDAPTIPATILDPFFGSGTTGEVALKNRRNFIGIDANPTYATELVPERLNGTQIKLMGD